MRHFLHSYCGPSVKSGVLQATNGIHSCADVSFMFDRQLIYRIRKQDIQSRL